MTHFTRSKTASMILFALAALLLVGCMAPMAAGAPAGGYRGAAPAEDAAVVGERAAAEESAAEAPMAEGAAAEDAVAEESAADGDWAEAAPARSSLRDERSHAAPPRDRRQEPVTAGVVDDNEQWEAYLDYRERHGYVRANDVDVSERYVIEVLDVNGAPVHDATVEIYLDKQVVFQGRTDAGGRLRFHPRALPTQALQRQFDEFRVVASDGWVARSQTFPRRQRELWTLQLDEPQRRQRTQLDLLFLIDATGSMGDEIAKLKSSMADVADRIDGLPEAPDVRYGLVAYRDLDDAFVVQEHEFTADLSRFQQALARVRADGGGDEPESLNEALHRTIHNMSWRPQGTVRLVILVADAPPHLDYHWQPFSYETEMVEAVGKGIKLFPVGASGLNEEGEYIFRQLAQFTGGKFVFLTYDEGGDPSSGPGTETGHDVDTYSVNTLDRLIVRLVREELAMLPQAIQRQGVSQAESPLPLAAGQ